MDLTELDKLEAYLQDHNIPYERLDNDIRHQISVPSHAQKKWDAICQIGSYGYEGGLLEIYGKLVKKSDHDSVVGWLTADDVIARIERG